MSWKTRKATMASFVLVVLMASAFSLISSVSVDSETTYGGTNTSVWNDVSNIIPESGVISGNYILDRDVTLAGTLTIAEDTSVNLDLNGHRITAAEGSRAFSVSGTLTIQDYAHGAGSIIGKGTVSGDGGCMIINLDGTVNLYDVTIKGFYATGNGGAVHVASGSTLNMYGAVIGDQSAVTNAEIDSGQQVTSSNKWVNHNGSSQGNICDGQGGGISVSGTLNMYSGKVCGNVALSTAGNQGGGGLYLDSESTVDIRSGEISNNVGNSGGAIYSKCVPTIGSAGGSVMFRGNVASVVGSDAGNCGNGGAIYMGGSAGTGEMTFTNASFIGNTSARFGGAIEIQSIPANKIQFQGCVFESNHSLLQDAGALVIDYNSSITLNMIGTKMEDNISGYSVDGSTVSGNRNGGAICFYKGAITLNLNNTEISNNKANNGGAFYSGYSCTSVVITGGVIHDNYATSAGGALYVGKQLTLSSGTSGFPEIYKNTTRGSGGAIYVASTFIMNGGSIYFNEASTAGAIYCNGDAKLNGGTITDNRGTDCMDIYLGSGKALAVNGTSIRNDTLTSSATVIKVGGTATFTSGLIKYNLIDSDGDENVDDIAAGMVVDGTIKVIGADIVNCNLTIGANAYLYCSSQGRLSDGNITKNGHTEVKQYYTNGALYAFVMVPSKGLSNAISTIIDADVLATAGVEGDDLQEWYSVWEGQSDSKKVNIESAISSLSTNRYAMYSVKSVVVKYTLKFDADGGSLSGENYQPSLVFKNTGGSITFSQGSGKSTISTTDASTSYGFTVSAIKQGYTFKGWLIGGSGSVITDSTVSLSRIFSKDLTVTIYACWELTSYTVFYYPNGGSGLQIKQVTDSTTVTLDSTYSGIRDGYIFIGWNTNSDGTGTHFATGQECTFGQSATVILYAQWIRPSYSGSLTIGSATT